MPIPSTVRITQQDVMYILLSRVMSFAVEIIHQNKQNKVVFTWKPLSNGKKCFASVKSFTILFLNRLVKSVRDGVKSISKPLLDLPLSWHMGAWHH